MMSYSSSSATFVRSLPRSSSSSSPSKNQKLLFYSVSSRRPFTPVCSLRIGVEEIAEIAQNKVLVAATLASAIGQLSKPLTSALNGKGIDLKSTIRSGGMPSTHSAAVVAAATSLGLERGFSDSIFGMSVVFAAIVMYDAQGVRREVGYHAKILNWILKNQEKPAPNPEEDDLINSKPRTSSINSENLAPLLSLSKNANSCTSNSEPYSFHRSGITSSRSGVMPSLAVDDEDQPEKACSIYHPLNESVGHTEVQVLVGALLGFIVSLSLDVIL